MTKKELYLEICKELNGRNVDAKLAGIPFEDRINKRWGCVGVKLTARGNELYFIWTSPNVSWKYAWSEKKMRKDTLESIYSYITSTR